MYKMLRECDYVYTLKEKKEFIISYVGELCITVCQFDIGVSIYKKYVVINLFAMFFYSENSIDN